MKPLPPPSRLLAATLFIIGSSLAAVAQADVYMYNKPDGSRYFSDHKAHPSSGYAYIGKYGRPTAYASCKGMTPALLQERAQRYQPLIRLYGDQYNVDTRMIKAVMRVESCFDSNARSRVGAGGLMQLMPKTAAHLGVKDRFNPAQNIRGGVRYLRMMLDRFNNNWKLALAAYNAGPGAVDKYNGVPPYKETRSYIRRIMTIYNRNL